MKYFKNNYSYKYKTIYCVTRNFPFLGTLLQKSSLDIYLLVEQSVLRLKVSIEITIREIYTISLYKLQLITRQSVWLTHFRTRLFPKCFT